MFQGNLQLKLGNFALDSGEFAFESSGVTVLFGRSGSGKSTLLRAMSGLDKQSHGELRFNDEVWQSGKKALPVEQRDIGFVFQTAALLPNKNVQGNLDFAIKRIPKHRQHGPSTQEIIERVGISHLLNRPVDNLSGGERQRVAIARALLTRPRLLMMDEPLSALDWRAKSELLLLIESVIADYQIPTLYITHAPIEVERLANRVVFMADGKITSIESLGDATSRIDSPLFTEEGPVSVLHGQLGDIDPDGLIAFQSRQQPGSDSAFTFWLNRTEHSNPHASGAQARLRVLARDVAIALHRPEGISMLNQIPATISQIEAEPPTQRQVVFLALADGQTLLAELSRRSVQRLGLAIGQTVFALVKTAALLDR
ncbi:molybdenum ABC transporter ATP-binding protein [Halothiobacillus neapolitanus]|uniref:Molybdate ABC transporter, ATPase subunit n=1 Tax=Halothiobacillus neapolitanus (strain ATCC 23641 / DSM 15147 / CIP 104769 / NCIMB 8539 / c2) TaxID=555778 RepID=D0KYY3_HALNC|nr:molybdenum ABC transporter ATP-binding protein [Halothiobacillus neapolitanus]ACX95656.1 molybdate ABC transporter, ATPase subunit [Halothiobacillus neapolitanus c2]TDN65959.1 molybdate transport system ATP-binding protein [Halothiobacillus neapolitanus]